ncbi:MAG: transcriptional regulator [Nitrososphaerales archaeon]
MPSDRLTGVLLLVIGVIGILLYGWLLFFYSPTLILQLTAFIGVAVILAIVAWIGYTMATTPPPEPLDVGEVPEPTSPPEPAASEEPEAEKKEAPKTKRKKSK